MRFGRCRDHSLRAVAAAFMPKHLTFSRQPTHPHLSGTGLCCAIPSSRTKKRYIHNRNVTSL
jgi:hypothetical protein